MNRGRLYACITSRPVQSGRCDGLILEGKELEEICVEVCPGAICWYAKDVPQKRKGEITASAPQAKLSRKSKQAKQVQQAMQAKQTKAAKSSQVTESSKAAKSSQVAKSSKLVWRAKPFTNVILANSETSQLLCMNDNTDAPSTDKIATTEETFTSEFVVTVELHAGDRSTATVSLWLYCLNWFAGCCLTRQSKL